jgi:hypothetical protein
MQINGQALTIRILRHHYKLPSDEVRKKLGFQWMSPKPNRESKNFSMKQVAC